MATTDSDVAYRKNRQSCSLKSMQLRWKYQSPLEAMSLRITRHRMERISHRSPNIFNITCQRMILELELTRKTYR